MKKIASSFLALYFFSFLSIAVCQDEKKDAKAQETKAKKPATEVVKKEDIQVYKKLSGIVESKSMTPVKADMKSFKSLVVEKWVPEGSTVNKGDLVLEFKKEDYNRTLESSATALKLAKLDLDDAKIAVEQVNKTFKMDKEKLDRDLKHALADYEHYKKVLVPQRLEMLDYSMKQSEWRLENALEEYNQLKKMYNEDELTEESEKIVLKRAERSVDSAKMWLKREKINYDRAKKVLHDRQDQAKKEEISRLEISQAAAKTQLPFKVERTRIALEKSTAAYKKQFDDHGKIKSDGEKLNLAAPAKGIVYYGKCTRGKWVGPSGTPSRTIEKGKTLMAGKTLFTIIDPENLQLRLSLDESSINSLKEGMEGTAIPVATPNQKLKVTIKKISRIPLGDGKFDCIADLAYGGEGKLLPGMNCKVVFLAQSSSGALTLPKAVVFSDDEGLTHYVYVSGGEKPTRKTVTTGVAFGDRIEIRSGLSEGDKVLKKKP